MKVSSRIGRYRLGERIGEGGMAEVYLAEDEAGSGGLTMPLALKMIRPGLTGDPAMMNLFTAEARLAQRLRHGNIVQVVASGREGNVPFLVMEYIDGLSLASLLKDLKRRGERLPVADAIFIVEQLSTALDYAHRLVDDEGRSTGVMHRDVNARNVLISREGVVKLADFGIAKAADLPSMTIPGQVKGTLGCMSPEQAHGLKVDFRTDIWSTGVLLYELIAGEHPFVGVRTIDDYIDVLDSGIPRLVPTPPANEELAEIIRKATHVDPTERYPSMADFRGALEHWRVSHRLRREPDHLRALAKRALGLKVEPKPRLDEALLAQLGGAETKPTVAEPRPKKNKGSRPLLVAALLFLIACAVVALVAYKRSSASGSQRTEQQASAPKPQVASAPSEPERLPAIHVVAEALKSDEPKTNEPKTNEPKTNEPKTNEPKTNEPKTNEPKTNEPKTNEPKTNEPKTNEPKTNEPKTARRSPGRIKINLLPYAVVRVNGEPRGQTPVELSLRPGSYKLELHNPDTGHRIRRTVEVQSGKIVSIKRW